ncbi:MAG: hypothetical protein Q4G60_03185 [bacterium]|nr:hypothetical protein [bacterium]
MSVIIFVIGMCTGALLMWAADMYFTGKSRLDLYRPKKWGKMDKLYLYNVIFVTATTIATFTIVIFSGKLGITDLSPICTVDTAAFTELGIHTGFIVWKSKVENCRKFKDVNRAEALEQEVV